MNELDFQAKLVKNVKDGGGFAFKVATRHMAGIPDVFLKPRVHQAVFVECKVHTKPNTLPLALTALQCETLKRLRAAGQHCGWMVLHDLGPTDKVAYAGADTSSLIRPNGNCDVFHLSGPKWPLDEMVRSIVHWSEMEVRKL